MTACSKKGKTVQEKYNLRIKNNRTQIRTGRGLIKIVPLIFMG